MQIKAECSACGGTGLYKGFAEPPEHAVVCNGCNGTGCETITYTPFTARKQKRGIKYVFTSSAGWTGRSCDRNKITIQEFYRQ